MPVREFTERLLGPYDPAGKCRLLVWVALGVVVLDVATRLLVTLLLPESNPPIGMDLQWIRAHVGRSYPVPEGLTLSSAVYAIVSIVLGTISACLVVDAGRPALGRAMRVAAFVVGAPLLGTAIGTFAELDFDPVVFDLLAGASSTLLPFTVVRFTANVVLSRAAALWFSGAFSSALCYVLWGAQVTYVVAIEGHLYNAAWAASRLGLYSWYGLLVVLCLLHVTSLRRFRLAAWLFRTLPVERDREVDRLAANFE